jgi:hypothetical protein
MLSSAHAPPILNDSMLLGRRFPLLWETSEGGPTSRHTVQVCTTSFASLKFGGKAGKDLVITWLKWSFWKPPTHFQARYMYKV